jgi:hypothetical protein
MIARAVQRCSPIPAAIRPFRVSLKTASTSVQAGVILPEVEPFTTKTGRAPVNALVALVALRYSTRTSWNIQKLFLLQIKVCDEKTNIITLSPCAVFLLPGRCAS